MSKVLAFTRIVAAAAFAVLTGSVTASAQTRDEEDQDRGNWAIGVTAGTLGVGLEVALRLHPNLIVRASATGGDLAVLGWGDQVTISTNTTGALFGDFGIDQFMIMSGGVMADWHPFRDGGRLSAGVRYIDYSIEGSTKQGGGASPAFIGAKFEAQNNSKILPYVGFGYDSAFFKQYGLSISTDFGVLIGAGKHDVKVTGGTLTAVQRAAQQQEIANDLSKVSVFPVIMLTGKYRF